MRTCRYFKGDRPCQYYWIDRSWDCSKCSHYNPHDQRILIIKLGTLGDVIRSTPIVQGFKKQYPNSQITWLVEESSEIFLKGNPYIERIKIYSEETIRTLQSEKFDVIVNLDKDSKSTSLMNIFTGREKLGYGLSSEGYVIPLNGEANYQYEICLDNWGKKKGNQKTYIEMLFDISKLKYHGEKPFLHLDNNSFASFTKEFLKQNNITPNNKLIILNTGCGPVYPHKKWTYEGYKNLIEMLSKDENIKIILTGSEHEIERNYELKHEFIFLPNLINTTGKLSIEQLCLLINLCDIMVTGDTMVMHIAIALNKKIVAFFGPSPYNETDLFGLGVKMIRKELDCLVCHDQFPCPYNGKCMSLISAQDVYHEIKTLLA